MGKIRKDYRRASFGTEFEQCHAVLLLTNGAEVNWLSNFSSFCAAGGRRSDFEHVFFGELDGGELTWLLKIGHDDFLILDHAYISSIAVDCAYSRVLRCSVDN